MKIKIELDGNEVMNLDEFRLMQLLQDSRELHQRPEVESLRVLEVKIDGTDTYNVCDER